MRAPIEKTEVEFIVNTNWDLFHDKKGKTYYLLVDKTWLSASALAGPWAVTGKLPDDLTKLPANQNWDDVKKAIPPTVSPTMRGPDVFFTDKPAELILFQGEPAYLKIPGTNVSYANNSENDVFLHTAGESDLLSDLGPLVSCQVAGRSLELRQCRPSARLCQDPRQSSPIARRRFSPWFPAGCRRCAPGPSPNDRGH